MAKDMSAEKRGPDVAVSESSGGVDGLVIMQLSQGWDALLHMLVLGCVCKTWQKWYCAGGAHASDSYDHNVY